MKLKELVKSSVINFHYCCNKVVKVSNNTFNNDRYKKVLINDLSLIVRNVAESEQSLTQDVKTIISLYVLSLNKGFMDNISNDNSFDTLIKLTTEVDALVKELFILEPLENKPLAPNYIRIVCNNKNILEIDELISDVETEFRRFKNLMIEVSKLEKNGNEEVSRDSLSVPRAVDEIKENIQKSELKIDAKDFDELFISAAKLVVELQVCKTSIIQRILKLGYAKAAYIVDKLEENGIVGPNRGAEGRKVLFSENEFYEIFNINKEKKNGDSKIDLVDSKYNLIPNKIVNLGNNAEVKKIKDIVNNWSKSIPYNPHKNFGDIININEIKYFPIYKIALSAIIDYRKLFLDYKPNSDNSRNPLKRILRNEESVWEIESPYYDNNQNIFKNEFTSDINKTNAKYTLPASYNILSCSTCRGMGKLNCSLCRKSGYVLCSRCTNGYLRCSSCDGSRNERDYNNRAIICRRCNGSGTEMCYNCNGSGKIVCSNCNGYGEITCNTCAGFKELVHFQGFHSIIEVFHEFKSIFSKEIPDVLSVDKKRIFNLLNGKGKLLDDYIVEDDGDFDVEKINIFAEKESKQKITDLIQTSKTLKSFGEYRKNYKFVKQQIMFEEFETYKINYTFESKNYELWIFGDSVWRKESPIDNLIDSDIAIAKQNMKSLKFDETIEIGQKVLSMNTYKSDVEALVHKARKLSKIECYLGSFLGSLIPVYYGWEKFSNAEYINLQAGEINLMFLSIFVTISMGSGYLFSRIFEDKFKIGRKRFLFPLITNILFLFVLFFYLDSKIKDNYNEDHRLNAIYEKGVSLIKSDQIDSGITILEGITSRENYYIESQSAINFAKGKKYFIFKNYSSAIDYFNKVNSISRFSNLTNAYLDSINIIESKLKKKNRRK